MQMKPDYEKAAVKATETLVKYGINTAPVMPLPIFKRTPGVLVLSFAECSGTIGINRENLVTMFGAENQDAVTSVKLENGKLHYIVAYNQRLPLYMLQRALARELGHIILGHDGSLPEDVRMEEARCFACHFLCPRALVHALAAKRLTVEAVGSVTGCYERSMNIIRRLPGVHVPAELNRAVRDNFSEYIANFKNYQSILSAQDTSPLAEFGSYMDGYEE